MIKNQFFENDEKHFEGRTTRRTHSSFHCELLVTQSWYRNLTCFSPTQILLISRTILSPDPCLDALFVVPTHWCCDAEKRSSLSGSYTSDRCCFPDSPPSPPLATRTVSWPLPRCLRRSRLRCWGRWSERGRCRSWPNVLGLRVVRHREPVNVVQKIAVK